MDLPDPLLLPPGSRSLTFLLVDEFELRLDVEGLRLRPVTDAVAPLLELDEFCDSSRAKDWILSRRVSLCF